MKKIITAIGSQYLNNELRKTNNYDIKFNDIAYEDAIFEVLENNEIDIAIIYEELIEKGNIEMFLEKMNMKYFNVEIILVLNSITQEMKRVFRKYEIKKVILINELTIKIIEDSINCSNELENIQEKINSNKQSQEIILYNKKVIVVSGCEGAGKTTVLLNIVKTISKYTNKKILIIDFDTSFSNIDIFLGISKINNATEFLVEEEKKCVLNYLIECMQKDILNLEKFMSSLVEVKKIKNTYVLTGNNSLFVCQNVLKEEYYCKILEFAKQEFDYILIDTNSNVFLDSTKWAVINSDKIFFVMESTYKDLSKIKQIINVYMLSWKINIKKISVILNKQTCYSLNKDCIAQVLENIEVASILKFNEKHIFGLNNGYIGSKIDKTIELEYMQLLGINKKENLVKKFWNKIRNGVRIDNKSITGKK